jgi:hypothetical protein
MLFTYSLRYIYYPIAIHYIPLHDHPYSYPFKQPASFLHHMHVFNIDGLTLTLTLLQLDLK